jgi:hypothetical protein
MRNYFLTIAILALLFGLILFQSKPLVKSGISLKGQNIDNLGIQMASAIESQFLGIGSAMTFHKKTISQTEKSAK